MDSFIVISICYNNKFIIKSFLLLFYQLKTKMFVFTRSCIWFKMFAQQRQHLFDWF